MSTFILKRVSYSLSNQLQSEGNEAGQAVGSTAGSLVGGATGAAVGGAGAGLIGAGVGASKGWKKASDNNKIWNEVGKTREAADSMAKSMATASQRGVTDAGVKNMAKEVARTENLANAAKATAAEKGVTGSMSKAGTAFKKAGKYGAIAAGAGMLAGGLLGASKGSEKGGQLGSATAGAVGATVGKPIDMIGGR